MNPQISRRTALGIGAAAGVSVLMGSTAQAAEEKRRVIVWSEGTEPKDTYPDGIRAAVAAALKPLEGWEVITRTITDDSQGIPESDLAKTDVLFWWGHKKHGEVKKENIELIDKQVRERGMGFVALHSSHFAEPYKKLMGTPCSWTHYIDDGSSVEMLLQKPQQGGRRGGNTSSDSRPLQGRHQFHHPQDGTLRRSLQVQGTLRVHLLGCLHPPRWHQATFPHDAQLEDRQGKCRLLPTRPRNLSHLLPERSPATHAQLRRVVAPARTTTG